MSTLAHVRPFAISVTIPAAGCQLSGDLMVPAHARGIVIFAHGSGSSRLSVRNRHVAEMLNEAGLATLLMDLLTSEEEHVDRLIANLRFDIPFLAERVLSAVDFVRARADTGALDIGCFGASTGAGAALIGAALRPTDFAAVVSRAGRPDLALEFLPQVKAPTLLIVGELDVRVIAMNRHAMSQMKSEVGLEIVPGASHLFEEPGTLDKAARLAADWFTGHLGVDGSG